MLEKTPEKDTDKILDATAHPFDRATQVANVDGHWRGTASEEYFAFVGPFGGVTARDHAARDHGAARNAPAIR